MLIKKELEIRIRNESFDSQCEDGNLRAQSLQRIQKTSSNLLGDDNIHLTNSQEILLPVVPVLLAHKKSSKHIHKYKSKDNCKMKSKFANTKQKLEKSYQSESNTSNISKSLESEESQSLDEEGYVTTKELQNKNSLIKHPQIQRIENEMKSSVSCGKIKKSKSSCTNSTFSHQLKNAIILKWKRKANKHESSKLIRFKNQKYTDEKIDIKALPPFETRSVELNIPKINSKIKTERTPSSSFFKNTAKYSCKTIYKSNKVNYSKTNKGLLVLPKYYETERRLIKLESETESISNNYQSDDVEDHTSYISIKLNPMTETISHKHLMNSFGSICQTQCADFDEFYESENKNFNNLHISNIHESEYRIRRCLVPPKRPTFYQIREGGLDTVIFLIFQNFLKFYNFFYQKCNWRVVLLLRHHI